MIKTNKVEKMHHNVFTSKADVLKFLKKNLKKAKIERLFDFTISEWNENHKIILEKIQKEFRSGKIIIRSSAIGEDSLTSSEAGKYESILDVPANNKMRIKNAIKKVIGSYRKQRNFSLENQILVQQQTKNILVSGVIMTREGISGAPYYIINYDDSSDTTTVTGGLVSNTIKFFRNTSSHNLPTKWNLLLNSVKEIERLLKRDNLDIEFAITKNSQVVLFQVRPITSLKENIPKNTEQELQKSISNCKRQFATFKKSKNVMGDKTYFSDMMDWNPAEIIGVKPNILDYSLYDVLIMNDAWHKGRTMLGYHDVDPCKLMVRYGNKPYVDVRSSFNSFLPDKLRLQLKNKLVNFYLRKFFQNPHLHDKVEFDIVFSCYDFSTDERLKELLKAGFSKTEIDEIRSVLIDFTNTVIGNFHSHSARFAEGVKEMHGNRSQIFSDLHQSDVGYYNLLKAADMLLRDCYHFGTIPFSAMARIAFIGSALLKSLLNRKLIEFRIYKAIMNSVDTIVTQFQKDCELYHEKKLTKDEFLGKYGHLRPGTYDITALRYDQSTSLFENMFFTKKRRDKLTNADVTNIERIVQKTPLEFHHTDFLTVVSKSLALREELKFQFTKNLSDALELIAQAGKDLGFSRNEMANIEISTILKSYKSLSKKQMQASWEKEISHNKKKKFDNDLLILPPIIFTESDFEVIQYHVSKPNYISEKAVSAKLVSLDKNNFDVNLENNIVLIENADPGFDWIFTKNPSGLITKYGGVASHMAIRCAEIDLPAAIGCGELIYDKLRNSSRILLDCKNNQIVILENKTYDEFAEEQKILKSLGYIK
jgi:phosphohistidine swiveling domain-containing protein